MDIDLTKDARKILKAIYDAYVDKTQYGILKQNARSFGSSEALHDEYINNVNVSDINEALRELNKNGYIKTNENGAREVLQFYIEDKTFVYMENKGLRVLMHILEFIKTTKDFIPFLK